MRNVPNRLLGFIAVALAVSIYLIWTGQSRDDTVGTVIVVSGVVGLLCFLSLIAAIIVRSRKE
ncbi:MAG: hypothetical protein JWQ99_132 [Blastococcus sp.]|jgi:hypothetical protein|nr:hypothetical protein [Blastococcus sp.]